MEVRKQTVRYVRDTTGMSKYACTSASAILICSTSVKDTSLPIQSYIRGFQ